MMVEPHRIETAIGPFMVHVDDAGVKHWEPVCAECGAIPPNMYAHRCGPWKQSEQAHKPEGAAQ